MNIFELAGAEDSALAALESALLETQGEVTPEVESLMLAADIAADELAEKVDSYGWLIAKLEGEAATFDGEAKRLAAHATSRKNSAKRLKENLLFVLQTRGDKTVTGKVFSASVTANGGKLPVVIDDEAAAIEAGYTKVIIDEASIRADLEANPDTPNLVAHFGERGSHLRIR